MSNNRFARQRGSYSTGGKATEEGGSRSPWRQSNYNDDDSQSRTITPTSSQEEGAPARTKSWVTRSANDRKPWMGSASPQNSGKSVRRSPSSEDHVLHTPKQPPPKPEERRLTMPSSPDPNAMEDSERTKSFDDLWDESGHGSKWVEDATAVTPSTPNPAEAKPAAEFDTSKFSKKKPPNPAEPKPTPAGELDTSKFPKSSTKKPPPAELDTTKLVKKPPPTELDTSKFSKSPAKEKAAAEFDTSKFAKSPASHEKAAGEFDTSKFAKKPPPGMGSRAPPNTPLEGVHHAASDSAFPAAAHAPLEHRKKNPIKHPRKPRRHKSHDKKDKALLDSKPSAIDLPNKDAAALQKQLDRVTFLQKRQFDQLNNLKKMLLASRTKEKECVKSSEEWQTKTEERGTKIAALQKQLDQSQSELHLSKQKLKRAQSAAVGGTAAGVAAVGSANTMEAQLAERDDNIAQLERRLQEMESKQQDMQAKEQEEAAQRQTKITEVEQRLQQMETTHNEATAQLQNSLAITESKLRKKMEQAEQVHEEMEELREQLTTAHSSIEQLEEERNYSRAKMAELNDMVASKGGISDKEQELMDRAAEISNLTSKLNAIDGKVQDRDDKIFKLEEEIKSINELVKQLSDGFVAEDDELTRNQQVLLESATSPAQASSLLLMTMMNMLDSLNSKMTTLQKERDDMNAKAADRGIQLAESHIRVDKLRTELRRMRAERDRSRGGRGSEGPPDPNGPRRQQQQQANAQTPRHASHTNGTPPPRRGPGGWAGSGGKYDAMNNQSERDNLAISTRTAPSTPAAPPAPRQSRFMSFLKGNLNSEVGPEPENGKPQDRNAPPLVVQT